MRELPVGPFAWGWALAGVGLTMLTSCALMPWMYLEAMAVELARQDREDVKAAAIAANPGKVLPLAAPARPAWRLGRRVL